jgi:hypothetical protein
MTTNPRARVWLVAIALLAVPAVGCVTLPTGPSVMVLPGSRTSFEQFQVDDQSCRGYALAQSGVTTDEAQANSGVTSAAVGTAVGAAAGVAIGAATGNPGAGAAIGAASGLLFGSAVGADRAQAAAVIVQQRYDSSYIQCMYAKGNQVPIARSALRDASPPPRGYERRATPPSRPPSEWREEKLPPPPPPGLPPPPPPDAG